MDSKREGINFWFVTVKMIVNKAKTGPIGNHRSRLPLKKKSLKYLILLTEYLHFF